ncbi:hypothetical protein [Rhizobium phage RHEph15]|nr:hypothetical protein [Rhizobium phage RHEph15]
MYRLIPRKGWGWRLYESHIIHAYWYRNPGHEAIDWRMYRLPMQYVFM